MRRGGDRSRLGGEALSRGSHVGRVRRRRGAWREGAGGLRPGVQPPTHTPATAAPPTRYRHGGLCSFPHGPKTKRCSGPTAGLRVCPGSVCPSPARKQTPARRELRAPACSRSRASALAAGPAGFVRFAALAFSRSGALGPVPEVSCSVDAPLDLREARRLITKFSC